jgi:hypothetical protein
MFLFFMQKLLGTSSGKNNKRCRKCHNDSNKICFAFFWFLYDFLRNLQEPAKALILFQIRLCSKVPGSFGFLTYVPLLRGKTLKKSWPYAIRSPGAAGGGLAGILARAGGRSGRGRRGKGLWVTSGRFGDSVGARSSREGGHAGGQGRWPPRLPVPARGRLGGAEKRAGEQLQAQGRVIGVLWRPRFLITVTNANDTISRSNGQPEVNLGPHPWKLPNLPLSDPRE